MFEFPGVALVTGAASGIGAAVVHAFAEAGCERIVLIDRDDPGLESTGNELSEASPDVKFMPCHLDISESGAMERTISKVVSTPAFGRVDYCVNCAGMNGVNKDHPPTNSTDTSVDYFDLVNGVNYRGTWMASRAYLNAMMKQEPLESHNGNVARAQRGAIVNLSSGLGVILMPKNPVYSASKSAINAMNRSDAVDYSEHKIRINCVCPGLIDTPMTHQMGDDPAAMQWVVDQTPLKRLGQPEEIADLCTFLCSTKASWIQGQSIIADGGIVLM